MYATQIDPKRMPGYEFEIEQAPIQFGFCLSGKNHTQYTAGTPSRNSELLNHSGTNTICHMTHATGSSTLLSGEVSSSVAIQIDKEILDNCLLMEMGKIPSDCRRVLNGESPLCELTMTGEMHKIAAQIFTAPYEGTARQLFLEAKALELLSLQIAHLTRESSNQKGTPLNKREIESIRAAGDILINEMQAPRPLLFWPEG